MATFVLHEGYLESLRGATATHGNLEFINEDGLLVLDGWSTASRAYRNGEREWHREHYITGSLRRTVGSFYRVDPEVHKLWFDTARRDAAIDADYLKATVSGWTEPPPGHARAVLTICDDNAGVPTVLGWHAVGGQCVPLPIVFVDPSKDRLSPVESHWPLDVLRQKHVVVIGVGSTGSSACAALLDYGARHLTLIDPDLLDSHNFARHITNADQVGRRKVVAVAEQLSSRDTNATISALPLNVIEHADHVRPVIQSAAAVLVCSDGVASRRVANHLAVRAGVPAVYACVLENGAVGEVLRIRTPQFGCLLCQRRRLVEDGVMDPEPTLDGGYGAGIGPHLPMTAVGGDLAMVGQLAAKVTVASILEREGHRDQHLDGEHGIVGLRPLPTLPPPFDASLGAVTWHPGGAGYPDCPTCDRPA